MLESNVEGWVILCGGVDGRDIMPMILFLWRYYVYGDIMPMVDNLRFSVI